MGTASSWLVAEADQLDRIAGILDLQRSDGAVESERLAGLGVITPSDKMFLFEASRGWRFDRPKPRAAIAAGTTVHFFVLEEHVMFSSAESWQDGRRVWRIEHSHDNGGIYHLTAEGELPACFAEIRRRRFEEQDREGGEDARVDFISEIPLDVAQEVTGYDGGIDMPEGKEFWLVRPPRRGLLERWFGSRDKRG